MSLPNHHDADIVIKLYDLRREPVMRASRDAITMKFWPKSLRSLKQYLVQLIHIMQHIDRFLHTGRWFTALQKLVQLIQIF